MACDDDVFAIRRDNALVVHDISICVSHREVEAPAETIPSFSLCLGRSLDLAKTNNGVSPAGGTRPTVLHLFVPYAYFVGIKNFE